ncbi:MAG: hypothetical protein HN684_05990 [Euryarchaeota archaeon]|nr:hypothetical protein [Euryarchaeota archaeon]
MEEENIECDSCGSEFSIVPTANCESEEVRHCPFCGHDIMYGEEVEGFVEEFDDELDPWE